MLKRYLWFNVQQRMSAQNYCEENSLANFDTSASKAYCENDKLQKV